MIPAALALFTGIAAAQPPTEARFVEAFSEPLGDRWACLGGDWTVADGALTGRGAGDLARRGYVWRDVEAHATVAIAEADGPAFWAGLRLRTDSRKNPGAGYLVYLRRSGELEIWTQGKVLAARQTGLADRLARGEPVRLGARAVGTHVAGLVDGKVVVEAEHGEVGWGEVSLAVCGVTARFDDVECRGSTLGSVVSGHVLSYADLLPVPDALVETYHSLDGYPSLALVATRSDADGRFLLEGLPPGEKAYWVRASKEGMGGGTGWFVTVSQEQPTEVDLYLVDRPASSVWVDSASLVLPEGWEEVADPQCQGGGRAVVRSRAAEPPGIRCPVTVPEGGTYALHVASGLYEAPHYWSPYTYRLDGGEWREAASGLTLEGPRYGDRAILTWARTPALELAAGAHEVEFRLSGHAPAGGYYWTLDALALERLPEPVGPSVARDSTPELRWRAAAGAEVVLQLSASRDFSVGTLTVPHLSGGRWRVPRDLQLADGTHWWRLKPQHPESSCYRGVFGPPAALEVATRSPAIASVRHRAEAPDRATVSWETDESCESWIEWDVRTFAPRFRTPVTDGRTHVACLTGLEPMTCTRYWVVVRGPDGERRSLRRQFLTPRRELSGRRSPFGVFGQALAYAGELGAAGVEWMSDYWDWATLEPTRGVFDWRQAEERMARAEAAGLDLTVTFWGSPAWVRPSTTEQPAWAFTYGPEDAAATREFYRHVAAHCRGRVDWWLPWIEPNVGRDPTFGFPRGYWASRPHARTYAAHERAAYQGAKRGNPGCRLVGMNTAGVDLAFIEKCYDEGAAETSDVMNVHYYAMTGDFEKQNPEALFGGLRRLMAQYGDAEKPILCSEGGGTSSGLPDTDETMQATNLVRIYVLSIANGIDKLCWTFAYDPDPYGSARLSMVPWMGLFGCDPDPTHVSPDLHGSPKPAYFAYGTMTGLLAGSVYDGRVRLGAGVRAYRFQRVSAGGPQRITVLWSEEASRRIGLPVSGPVLECVDHLGAPVPAEARDGCVMLELADAPVYVVESAGGRG